MIVDKNIFKKMFSKSEKYTFKFNTEEWKKNIISYAAIYTFKPLNAWEVSSFEDDFKASGILLTNTGT